LLTLSGVVWGTFSIVLLLAFGVGLKKQSFKNMHGMGKGIAIVWPSRTTISYKGMKKGRYIRVSPEDIEMLRKLVPGIEMISPEFNRRRMVKHKKEELFNRVAGVNVEFAEMRNVIPEKGRFLDLLDIKEKRRVCFLGDKVAKSLFHEENPIGKAVYIERIPFMVIGVMKKKLQNSSYNGRDQDRIYIPYTTYIPLFSAKYVDDFVFKPNDPSMSKVLIKRMRTALGRKLGFSPNDRDALWVWDTTDVDKFLSIFFAAFNIFLGIIGSFTLIVGGVGVASIMHIVVEERVREIGIKLALGAKRRTILFQFFFEALSIVILGGAAGFLLAVFIVKIAPLGKIQEYVGIPQVNYLVGLITIAVLLTVGSVASLNPARKAASTNPIEALRE